MKDKNGNKLSYKINELIYNPVDNPNGVLIEKTEQCQIYVDDLRSDCITKAGEEICPLRCKLYYLILPTGTKTD